MLTKIFRNKIACLWDGSGNLQPGSRPDAYFGRARHFLFETNGVPSGKYVSEDGNKMSFFDGQAGSREREIASGGGRATLATD